MRKNFTFQLQATPNDTGFDVIDISTGEAKGHGLKFSDYENTPQPIFMAHEENRMHIGDEHC
ncbi:MAG: hypothetical protein M5U11_00695 [Anaerolineales bacterium]|nr:hypothetical protein [Anaerolineales bacterium]